MHFIITPTTITNFIILIATVITALRTIGEAKRSLQKPRMEIEKRLERDYDRLNLHDKKLDQSVNTMDLLLEMTGAMLEHAATDNATGKMATARSKYDKWLREQVNK